MPESHKFIDAHAPGDDSALPFAVEALSLRGRLVRLGDALDRIIRRHDYPEPVSRLIGEAITLTALIGTAMTFDGRLIVQTQSDGPVSMLVVDFEAPDRLRAYARFDAALVAEKMRMGAARSEDLLGSGYLALTIDQTGMVNRYQGIVPLEGTSLEHAAHRYFLQSEQIPTRVRLAVSQVMTPTPEGEMQALWRAGGLLVQFLPDAPERARARDLDPGDAPEGFPLPAPEDDDDAWTEAEALTDTAEDLELTDPAISAETLLYRLFHTRGVRVFARQSLIERCRCSRERIEKILESFGEEERQAMVVDGKISVTCEFCSSVYDFAAPGDKKKGDFA